MNCPKCNSDNPDTKQFCADCGTQLTPAEKISLTRTKIVDTPIEELSTGSTFAERYQIIEELGKGGMGKVYKVLDKEIDAKMALKLIKPEISTDKDTIERFRNELKTARDITHKNVCRMYDLNKEEDTYYITMEFVSGEDLKSFIRRAAPLSTARAISIGKQICEGLAEAHKLGVIHRDLKSNNIMVDNEGNVRIMDFGIARSMKAKGITGSGIMIGTPEYMSPEQAAAKDVDQRSDIYSLGVILYEMVTGSLPFEGDSPLSIAIKHKTEEPLDPRKFNTQLSEELGLVILRCLEKDRENRYQSAEEVCSELANIEKGIPTADRVLPRKKPLTSKEITVTLGWKKLFIPVVIVLVLAIVMFVLFQKKGPELDTNRIAVAIFENKTGNATHDSIGHMAADWITQGLAHTGLVDVVPSKSVENVSSNYEGENPILFLAKETKAGTVVSGSYYLQGDSIQFHVQVTDARNGKLIKALDPIKGPIEDPSKLIESLRQQLMVELAARVVPYLKEYTELIYMPPSYEAFKECVEGNKFFSRTEYKQALEHYLRAASLDPDYAQPRLWAAQSYMNIGEYAKADDLIRELDDLQEKLTPYDRYFLDDLKAAIQGDRQGRYRASVQVAQLSQLPADRYVVGQTANHINRPQEAVDLITPVDPERWLKDWFPYWNDLTRAHHMLGNHQQELKEARRGRKQYPDLLATLFYELRALAALGKIDEINERLDEMLSLPPQPRRSPGQYILDTGIQLRVHGFKEASLDVLERAIKWFESRPKEEAETLMHRTRLGMTLYASDKYEEAQTIYEGLHKEFPDDVDYLGSLGVLAARRGDREEAQNISRQLEAKNQAYLFGYHTWWRAHIAALLGEKENAVGLLREAHAQGVSYVYFIDDIFLEPLYDYPPFQELIKPKG